jgi:hypothetical protein
MRRSLVTVAVLFSVSLLGCGGADVEVPAEEELGSTTEALCSATTPSCDELDLTPCGRGGSTTSCCLGGNTYSCFCTYSSRIWACP